MFQIIIGISSFELVDVSCSVTERSDASKKEAAPKRTKTKLSFNEQREYDNIENDIMICEEKIDGLDREIAAAATDFTKLNHLMAEKESSEMKLEHLMVYSFVKP